MYVLSIPAYLWLQSIDFFGWVRGRKGWKVVYIGTKIYNKYNQETPTIEF